MSNTPHSRISDDEVSRSIESMLAAEADVESRLRLLVLYKISVMLSDNINITNITRGEVKDLQESVEKHIESQERVSNRIFGGAKVLGVMFVAIQGLFGYVGSSMLEQHQQNTIQVHKLIDKVQKLETDVFDNRRNITDINKTKN